MDKANVNALSYGSYTALHNAAYCGGLEAAALLIERGAKVNAVKARGKTPLDLVQNMVQNMV